MHFRKQQRGELTMKMLKTAVVIGAIFIFNTVLAAPQVMNTFQTLTKLQGEWKLAPADKQEGGATKKGPAAKLIGTDKTAMNFKVIGKGSTVQESLLPGTGKEMATMYHCDSFKNCSQIKATHYCAKQNQPKLVLDSTASSANVITMACDPSSALCNSNDGHVHKITHEMADSKYLKTTYTIFKDGKFKKNSIYHFVRK